MLYFLKAVGSRISNITLWVVNWSTFVWSTRPGQKRTDQDREEFNLADLILELAFLFVWDFFAQGNLVFTGKFRGKEIESFFRSGRFLGKLKRGRNACRWSTAPPSLLLRPVVPQFKPTTTDLQCRCSPICNYVHTMVHLVRADLTKIRHISNQQMPNCATSMNQSLLVHTATGRETLARHLTKHCNGKSHKTSDCTGKEVEPVSKGFKLKIEKVKGKQTSICSTSQTKLCHCVPARGVTSKSIQTVTNSWIVNCNARTVPCQENARYYHLSKFHSTEVLESLCKLWGFLPLA